MRNTEHLRNYFLGKDPQLKETMSDNSLRLCGIQGKFYVLRTELVARLTDLKNALEAADTTLQNNIDAEALARSGADDLLTNSINTVAGNLNTLSNNVYTKAQVDSLIDMIPKFDIEIVESLPTQDISETTIYLLPLQDGEAGNGYEEYIYINNNWELIGTTNIDLSDYYTKEEVNAKTFINTLTQDITIPENSELNPLLLSTGWWYTGTHEIRYGEHVDPTIYNNNLFYFNAEAGDQWFYFLPPNLEDGWNQLGTYLWFDSTDHIWQYSGYGVTYTVNNQSTDMQIPTAGAVYTLVANNAGFATPLTGDLYLADGTYPTLTKGYYYTNGHSIYINGSVKSEFNDTIFFVDPANASTCLIYASIPPQNNTMVRAMYSEGAWLYSTNTLLQLSNINTSMPLTPTDDKVPSTKLLKNSLPTNFAGTDGVDAGTSGLVPAPTAADDGKFLCADGTWQAGGGGSNITYGTTDLTPRSITAKRGRVLLCLFLRRYYERYTKL